MNLEQRFKKETGFDAYKDNDLEPKIPLGYYVEWLEEQLILSGVIMPTGKEGTVIPDLVGLCPSCREEISRNGVFNNHNCKKV